MGYMTEERRLIQETARAFAMKEVLPVANKLDPEKGDIPPELIQKLADMGYFGIVIPEQYGGLGLGVFEYCLITEELARAAADGQRQAQPARAAETVPVTVRYTREGPVAWLVIPRGHPASRA